MNGGGHPVLSSSKGADIVSQALHPDIIWHGFQPLRHLNGSAEIWSQFWQPLLHAIPDLTRRPYFFIGGRFEDGDWVCGTGDFIGTFARDWLFDKVAIPASGTSVHFRFGEFCKIVDGKIAETRLLLDLVDLIRQAGYQVLPPSLGEEIWIPGPMMGGGVLRGPQDDTATRKTLQLVEDMIFRGLLQYDQVNKESMGLARFWNPDMVWYGPSGIGTAYGLEQFQVRAQGPILAAFPDRTGGFHQARFAEGRFAASTGWPSLKGTHQDEYLGCLATGKPIGMNIMDFWKREGDLLLENWNLIDLVDACLQFGVDLFARLREMRASNSSQEHSREGNAS
jgi:predicted ester cyclase